MSRVQLFLGKLKLILKIFLDGLFIQQLTLLNNNKLGNILMNSQIQPHHYLESEEEQEVIQYIEVTDRSKIKAILKAQKEKSQVPEKQQPNNLIEKKIENVQKKEQNAKVNKFIKDDRERIHVKQVEQKQEKKQKQILSEVKKQKKLVKQDDKTEKLIEKKYPQQNPLKDNQPHQNKKRSNVKKQDSKIFHEKKRQLPQNRQQSGKQKQIKNTTSFAFQLQEQNRNGDKIQIEIEQGQEQQDNQIYIHDNKIDEYVTIAKKMIKIYDFIAIKAYANFVDNAFLIAGRLAKQFRQIKQINIPRNIQVVQTGKQGKKKKVRAAITIQLSLNNLNKNHMGYQQSGYINEKKNHYTEKKSAYNPKSSYPEKPSTVTPKYQQKKYIEKSSLLQKSKSSGLFKEKIVDERDLR